MACSETATSTWKGASPTIVACCCVSSQEIDVFRLWLPFYTQRVDAIAVVIVIEKDDDPEDLESLCQKAGIHYTIDRQQDFSWEHAKSVLGVLVTEITCSWVLDVEVDDFLPENSEIRGIVSVMETEGADFATATIIDRLAFGGRLATTDGVSSYEELCVRFPVSAAVTKRLARGCVNPPSLLRWAKVKEIDTLRMGAPKCSKTLIVERFRWRTGLETRLQRDICIRPGSHSSRMLESQHILDELRKFGRIRAERWLTPRSHRIHGWMNYEDIYWRAVAAVHECGKLVEVGVWQGRSLCYLAEIGVAMGKHLQIYGVDPFRNFVAVDRNYPTELRETVRNHSWMHIAAGNLHKQGMLDYVELLQLTSLQAARIFERETLDFVWIDGEHSYEAVMADIRVWWPLVKRGGALAGHDYVKRSVRKAVHDSVFSGGSLTQVGTSFHISKS